MDGEILRVGADATRRPDREEMAFAVEIRTVGLLTDSEGNAVEVLPGMVATVDILSGKRTVLEYLIEPVVRVKQARAARMTNQWRQLFAAWTLA